MDKRNPHIVTAFGLDVWNESEQVFLTPTTEPDSNGHCIIYGVMAQGMEHDPGLIIRIAEGIEQAEAIEMLRKAVDFLESQPGLMRERFKFVELHGTQAPAGPCPFPELEGGE